MKLHSFMLIIGLLDLSIAQAKITKTKTEAVNKSKKTAQISFATKAKHAAIVIGVCLACAVCLEMMGVPAASTMYPDICADYFMGSEYYHDTRYYPTNRTQEKDGQNT